MSQITKELELKGKTIKRTAFVGYGERVVIVFTDGDYVVFETERGYNDDVDVEIATGKLEDTAKFSAGLMSQEEYDQSQENMKRQHKQQAEARERGQLEHLRKKYEGESV